MYAECIYVEMNALAMHFIDYALQLVDNVFLHCGVSFSAGKEVWYGVNH